MAHQLEEDSTCVDKINPDWLCGICQNISKDPVILNDDHHHIYCNECINNWFRKCAAESKPLKHPMTNLDITCDYKLHPQQKLKQKISKLYRKYKMKKDKKSQAFYVEHLSHFDTKHKLKFDKDKNNNNIKKSSEYKAKSTNLSITYSNTYKQSPGFHEMEDAFNTKYEMEILLNRHTQRIAIPEILFFKDLHVTLLKIGCNEKGVHKFMIQVRDHILKRMIWIINSAGKKTKSYELLSRIEQITINAEADEKMPIDENFINHSRTAKFICKLKCDFDEWKKETTKKENTFMREISAALKINSSLVQIKQTQRGSVIIEFWILNIWIPYHVTHFSHDPIPRNYNMRPNDQIEAKKCHDWWEATIVDIKLSADSNGKRFKVRYNPVNGKDLFNKNTEWFCSLKEGWRLHLPNKLYVTMNAQGVKLRTTFMPRQLSPVSSVYDVIVGHHIYVKYKDTWYRCEITEERNTYDGKIIKVMYLVHIFWKNEEWLELWKPQQVSRISLNDERPAN